MRRSTMDKSKERSFKDKGYLQQRKVSGYKTDRSLHVVPERTRFHLHCTKNYSTELTIATFPRTSE